MVCLALLPSLLLLLAAAAVVVVVVVMSPSPSLKASTPADAVGRQGPRVGGEAERPHATTQDTAAAECPPKSERGRVGGWGVTSTESNEQRTVERTIAALGV
jgi:hypothetical protein